MKKPGLVALSVLLVSTIVMSTGCPDEEDDVRLRVYEAWEGPDLYALPDTSKTLVVYCEPKKAAPDHPVYVWKISFDGYLSEEFVHDSKPEEEFIKTLSWPVYDYLDYTFEDLGIYTAQVDLYECDEYTRDKMRAEVLGTFTFTINCSYPELSIEATRTETSREFYLRAIIDNTKFLPYSATIKWEFIEESTGAGDTGETEFVSREEYLSSDGVHVLEHQFQKPGIYKVVFIVLSAYHSDKEIISMEITVDVTQTLQILVPAEPLTTGQEYTFTARTDSPEDLPDSPVYEWDFGDRNGLSIPLSNEATHLYTEEGNYTVTVTIRDSDSTEAAIVATATAEVQVEASADYLIALHQMKKFSLDFVIQHDYVEGTSGIFRWDWESYGEVVWDGVNGSMEWEQYGHSERMTCRVSEDGTMIEQLIIRHEYAELDAWYELEIQNLPFWEDTMPDRFIVDVDDEDVSTYVVYFNTYRTVGYQWTDDAMLSVRFEKE